MDIEYKMLPPAKEFTQENKFGAQKRKISLYLILTLSLSLFLLTFSLVETANAQIKKLTESRIDGLGEILGEKVLFSFLGIRDTRAHSQKNDTDNGTKKPSEGSSDAIGVDVTTDTASEEKDTPTPPKSQYDYPLISKDLSQSDKGLYYISNDTGHNPDTQALANSPAAIAPYDFKSKKPLVLIVHTHGTEAYTAEGADGYNDTGNLWRSNDVKENVVAVGAVMAQVLEENGIPTLHCQIMHDKESYNDAYTYSAATIKKYLKQYPSIKYVFDVHRDAIISSDGTLVKGVTQIGGESVAQVMCVAGSDFKGADYPHWEANLAFALKLRAVLNEKDPTLCRPVYLRGAAYNLQYTNGGSLLLEIGSSGNTLNEAKRAAVLVAEALAKLIAGK
ncbi:MAG: stage II sporulation protein P [Clostridia bacterium]|nr:stage II sporulation protein P [Clostridia bacterium]